MLTVGADVGDVEVRTGDVVGAAVGADVGAEDKVRTDDDVGAAVGADVGAEVGVYAVNPFSSMRGLTQ